MSTAPARQASEVKRDIARARWWLAYPVAVLMLVLLDAGLGLWHPLPPRLPEQFSPAYLRLYLADASQPKPSVMFLGDSVLWGYKIAQTDTAVAELQRRFPRMQMLNVSYEGGSTPNSAVLLRYALAEGLKPSAVVIGINVKEFNQADSAYRTLHPSLEQAAAALLTPQDGNMLQLHAHTDLDARLNRLVESFWRFYRFRSDLREQVFGTDDMAGLFVHLVHRATGTAASVEAAHRPTPDRFLGTYDLSPINPSNVGMFYYRALIKNLCSKRIPAIAFLTPTNHGLLHDYIDAPEYQANIARLASVPRCPGVTIVNLDRALPPSDFIDNDHLTVKGQRLLADRLQKYLQKALR